MSEGGGLSPYQVFSLLVIALGIFFLAAAKSGDPGGAGVKRQGVKSRAARSAGPENPEYRRLGISEVKNEEK